MVLENPCYCGCLKGRCRRNANLRSLNTIRHPISGFQSRKRTCNSKRHPLNLACKRTKCKERCDTNRLGDFANRDFINARIFNSFSEPNVPCRCDRRGRCRKLDPNLKYRVRPIPRGNKNKCCNICLPDGVVNRGGGSKCCPPLKGDCNCNGSAAFKQTQNVCLCCRN